MLPELTCVIQAFENSQDPAVMSELQNLSCLDPFFAFSVSVTPRGILRSPLGSAMGFVGFLDCDALRKRVTIFQSSWDHQISKVQRLTSRFPLHADLAGPVVLAAQVGKISESQTRGQPMCKSFMPTCCAASSSI